MRPLLSKILLTFVQTVKENFFLWASKRIKSFKDKLSELAEGDEENRLMLEKKVKKISNLKASVMKFVNAYDTTSYQSRLIIHLKPLLETSVEWLGRMNKSYGNRYEIPVLEGKIVDLETKEYRKRVPSDLYTRTFAVKYPFNTRVADEERFKEFFNNFFCGRWRMAQYVMKIIILY